MEMRIIVGLLAISCLPSIVRAADFPRVNLTKIGGNEVNENSADSTKNWNRKMGSVVDSRPTTRISEILLDSDDLDNFEDTHFHRENVTSAKIDGNEVNEDPSKLRKNRKRKLGSVVDGRRPTTRITQTPSDGDDESAADLDNFEDSRTLEEGNRRILGFGKRVFESIDKHGLTAKDARLLKSGKLRIDWWKRNRRLEGMRRRLAEELGRNSGLKSRLRSLGWRNNSGEIPPSGKIHQNFHDEKSTVFSNGDAKNTILYQIFIMGFDDEEPNADSPTKFSLNTFDADFGALASDFGVIDVTSGESPSSSEETTSDPENPSGQVVDSDRILQLIPLVVEELREGRTSDEERRALRWIFGKRLWRLLEREASKPAAETMDHDLAKFLFKGELPERDPENPRLGRHQRRNDRLASGKRKKNVGRSREPRMQLHRDYDNLSDNYDDYYEGMRDGFR